jgi:hypothetical protein
MARNEVAQPLEIFFRHEVVKNIGFHSHRASFKLSLNQSRGDARAVRCHVGRVAKSPWSERTLSTLVQQCCPAFDRGRERRIGPAALSKCTERIGSAVVRKQDEPVARILRRPEIEDANLLAAEVDRYFAVKGIVISLSKVSMCVITTCTAVICSVI